MGTDLLTTLLFKNKLRFKKNNNVFETPIKRMKSKVYTAEKLHCAS